MKMSFFYSLILLVCLACGSNDDNSKSSALPQEQDLSIELLVEREDVIWGFDFLPDKRIIFSERSGRLMLFDPATRSEEQLSGLPSISSGGEGGLLDVKLHPDFSSNQKVYFCYTVTGRGTALASAVLIGSRLEQVQELFRTRDSNNSSIHFGCRIAFNQSNHIFLSIGDQADASKAQRADSHLGKILRLNDDGSIPLDNPFLSTSGALPEIWSVGHRNPQGLAFRPGTNELYSSEHGPEGGDELNLIVAGQNYGWPIVTKGLPRGQFGESAPGLVDPLMSWSPSIAPSGIAFHRGQLFIATLRGQHIRRIDLASNNQEVLFENLNTRFRNIGVGPDGLLYFSTDDGKLGRITEN